MQDDSSNSSVGVDDDEDDLVSEDNLDVSDAKIQISNIVKTLRSEKRA
jgi:hypothetical protein